MAHFAKVLNGTVIQVIVAEPDFFNTFVDSSPGEWIQTSYNTRGNIHYNPNSNTPSGNAPLRGNFAGVGYTYNKEHDVFYSQQPGNDWTLDTSSWLWIPPDDQPSK